MTYQFKGPYPTHARNGRRFALRVMAFTQFSRIQPIV
jgi:hypothetical protein